MQENNGINVSLSKKLEINLLVALVGLLEPLKLCLIVFVFTLARLYKQEFPLKI